MVFVQVCILTIQLDSCSCSLHLYLQHHRAIIAAVSTTAAEFMRESKFQNHKLFRIQTTGQLICTSKHQLIFRDKTDISSSLISCNGFQNYVELLYLKIVLVEITKLIFLLVFSNQSGLY